MQGLTLSYSNDWRSEPMLMLVTLRMQTGCQQTWSTG